MDRCGGGVRPFWGDTDRFRCGFTTGITRPMDLCEEEFRCRGKVLFLTFSASPFTMAPV